jgi:uncharacterized protein YbaP (TraB family)
LDCASPLALFNAPQFCYYSPMRHLRILFSALIALLSISRLPAQEVQPPPQSHLKNLSLIDVSSPTTKHSLWKVQGRSNVVYLLGTIHLLRATDYPLPQVMESAFTNSQIAVFEADIDKANDPMAALGMLSKITLPEGKTLQQVLPEKVYNSFSNHAQQAQIPMMMFDTIKPAMAVNMLDTMQLAKLGADPEYGVDEHFFKLAKETGRKIIPLETVEFQLNLLVGLSGPDEELMVEKTLEQMDDEKKEYDDMVTAWKIGDSAAQEKMLNEIRDAPVLFKKLVSDRTASWLPKVVELLHGPQNAIVIVGAGHLVGPDGLVELLKKQEFKVTQL